MPNRVKKAIKDLTQLSHDYVRRRDSTAQNLSNGEIGGLCFDCGKHSMGRDFQCGHWIPNSIGGALLRYHPHNMHGQNSGCNCGYQQEMVKIRYTLAMEAKYGKERVAGLVALKNRTIKADILFYLKMIDLYTVGDEQAIVDYLESL